VELLVGVSIGHIGQMSTRPSPDDTAVWRRVRSFDRLRAGWWYLAAQLVVVIALAIAILVV